LIGWSLDVLTLRQAVIATALLGTVPLLVAVAIDRSARARA
jgi:predicted RecB family endonuclease